MRLCDEIIEAVVGEVDLIKNVDFDGEDLVSGETVSSISSITAYEADEYWTEASWQATSDVVAQDNRSSGTVAQVKLSTIAAAGNFVLVVKVSTSNGQVLVAQCRLKVK